MRQFILIYLAGCGVVDWSPYLTNYRYPPPPVCALHSRGWCVGLGKPTSIYLTDDTTPPCFPIRFEHVSVHHSYRTGPSHSLGNTLAVVVPSTYWRVPSSAGGVLGRFALHRFVPWSMRRLPDECSNVPPSRVSSLSGYIREGGVCSHDISPPYTISPTRVSFPVRLFQLPI